MVSMVRGEERLRSDSSYVVVIDGVVGELLCVVFFDVFIEVGYDYFIEIGLLLGKWNWEMCDGLEGEDGESSSSSWGLTSETLEEVMKIDVVCVFCVCLVVLYLEYDICIMLSDVFELDVVFGVWGGLSICLVIGNVAVYGDMFNWYIDMDSS